MIDWEEKYYSGKNTAMVQVTVMDTETIRTMQNLAKRALRAGCKVLRQKMKESSEYSEHLKNHIRSSVYIDRKTGLPTARIGMGSASRVRKLGKIPSRRNPAWQETGIQSHGISAPKKGKNTTFLGFKKSPKGFRKNATSGGYIYFGVSVHHPGAEAQHTLKRICEENIDEVRKAEEKYLSQIAEEIRKNVVVDYEEEVDEGAD